VSLVDHAPWLYTPPHRPSQSRGDAVFKTKKLYVPHGVGDVLNTHILDSVRLRIGALRSPPSPGQAPSPTSLATADRLEGLLLEGAPTVEQQAAREAAFAELPVRTMEGLHVSRIMMLLQTMWRAGRGGSPCAAHARRDGDAGPGDVGRGGGGTGAAFHVWCPPAWRRFCLSTGTLT
jgi:hypothetical protein